MESLFLSLPRSCNAAPISTGESIWRGQSRKLSKTGFPSCSYGLQSRRTNAVHLCNKNYIGYKREDIKSRSTYQQRINKTGVVNTAATSQPSSETEPNFNNRTISTWDSIKDSISTIYEFLNIYAIAGAVVYVISVSLLAVEQLSDLNPVFYVGLLQALVPAILMNIFIIAVNHLVDIETDKINKPHRVLASGKLSVAAVVILIAFSLITSICLGLVVGSRPLLWAIFMKFVIGIGYSVDLPLLRWKKNALTAAIVIVALRAIVYPVGYFLHMQTHAFRRPIVFPRSLLFTVAISTLFFVAVSFSKDIPDIEGDRKYGVQSLAARLGAKRVFGVVIFLMHMANAVGFVAGLMSSNHWCKVITVSGHVILSLFLWSRAKSVDLESKVSLQSFYMFMWKIIYAEYTLVPFLR